MDFTKITETKLDRDSWVIILRVNPRDLILLGYILEAFEGFCNYTTINKKKMLVRITTTQDFVNDINKILIYLKEFDPNID